MTLLFQIDPATPPELVFFRDRYTFYPSDEIPAADPNEG